MTKFVSSSSFRDVWLDLYLEQGWFRMYENMFTTHSIDLDNRTFQVFWLRYHIPALKFGRKQKDLWNKNKNFTFSCEPLEVDDELEDLFADYKNEKPFIGYPSLQTAFYTDGPVFDTRVIRVRDGNRLIAGGIFDKGTNSIAGIMNFYHPDYERYSLGRLLILLKISFCLDNGIEWYYPGYITREPSRFSYKLFPDKLATEVYLPDNGIWVPYNSWNEAAEVDPLPQ